MERPICTIEGCTNPQKANGLCNTHNERRRLGKPMNVPVRRYAKQDPALIDFGLRTCNTCGLVKPVTDFYPNEWYCKNCSTAQAVGYKQANPEWNREQVKLYRERHPEKVKESKKASDARNPETRRKYRLKYMYDLTVEEFDALLAAQNGRCGICGTDKPASRRVPSWVVDHDHKTGRIRGLLCTHCNRGIGLLKDDPAILRAAIAYIERFKE